MSKKNFKGTGADLFFSDTPVPVQNISSIKNLKINPVFKALIPPLSQEEYSQLEENLLQNGIREAISVWNETIIDGHNRHEIAQKHNLPYTTVNYDFETENDVILWIIKNQFGRRNLSAYDRSILALRLKPVISEQAKVNQGTRTDILQNSAKSVDTRKELAEIAGVSHDTISKVEKIEQFATPEIKNQLKRGDISIHKAFQNITRQEKQQEKDITPPPLILSLNDTYNVIYADCPWKSLFSGSKDKSITNRLPQIKFEDIKTLKIPIKEDAILFMWTEAPILDKALQVMASWGFSYRTCAVWDKTEVSAGQWVREQHDMLLIGTKGKVSPPPENTRVSSVYREKHGIHTARPTFYYNLIENMFPHGRYLELFASEKHNEKWTVWGNENLFAKETRNDENNI